MSHYGETFRNFRLQKGYTMSQVAEGIVSTSFLSKFERGESEISLSLFVQLLDRLFISFDEFEFVHKNNTISEMLRFFELSDEAYLNRDLKRLKILKGQQLDKWRETGIEPFRCNAIMINVYEGIIMEKESTAAAQDLQFLFDYLFKVEVWGYYELFLYNSTILLMEAEMVIHLSEIVYKNSEKLKQHKKLHEIILRIMLNTLIYLTGGADPKFLYREECERFFTYLDRIGIPEGDLSARNSVLYLRGVYLLRLGDWRAGSKLIEESIQTLKLLGARSTAKYQEDYYALLKEKFT